MLRSFLAIATLVALVHGHGRVLDPPGRSSVWRSGYSVQPNYDDDGLNCGGFHRQYGFNNGACGICGDPWDAPEPRDHERGGKWDSGIITGDYTMGSVIDVLVDLTVSHRGFWVLKLCPDPQRQDQECFDQYVLQMEGGGTQFHPNRGSGKYQVRYQLPPGLVCDHCVLQWRYRAGNNWGVCSNGTEGLGCGDQETFSACSDIRIKVPNDYRVPVVNAKEDVPYPLLYSLNNGYFDPQQGSLHQVWKGQVGPNRIQPTSKDPHKKKHKTKLKQQTSKKQKSIQKTKANQTSWRGNTIGPNTRSEYYNKNLDTKLPLPSQYF